MISYQEFENKRKQDLIEYQNRTGHTLHECNEERCNICDGGLASCTICGGAEASLPTHCPRRPMTERMENLVESGKVDFKDGSWSGLIIQRSVR